MGKSQKSYVSIKSKLMAAVAMLLVASFMVVSSTYAWFTLSTAPEITGVKTSVGANGNLEIALLYSDSDSDSDSANLDLTALANNVQTTTAGIGNLVDRNKTWGNIIEISNASEKNPYGLDKITLMPSRLALAGATTVTVDTKTTTTYTLMSEKPLSVPAYGADGRISALSNDNMVHGTWTGTGFAQGGTGVRALGTVASMTQAELDYRSARLAYATAINNAFNLANNTLNANKQAMVNTVMSVAMGTTKEYDVAAIIAMINALSPETGDGLVKYLEDARKNIVKALYIVAASKTETYATPIDVTFAADGTPSIKTATATATVPNWDTSTNVGVMKDYNGLLAKITSIQKALADAKAKIETLKGATTTKDAETVKAILRPLFDTSAVKIGSGDSAISIGDLRTELSKEFPNGISVSNAEAVLTWMQTEGYIGQDKVIDAKMSEGAGIFADIHQATGRAISASADFMVVFTIRMRTAVTETYAVTYATNSKATGSIDIPYPTVANANASTDLTDYYGYALDFAFRTNAKNSNLQLQTKAINRIYSEGGSDDAMGGGSTMRFKSGDSVGFTEEDVANLMSSIRIVFVNDADEIIAVAGAKTETITEGSGKDATTRTKVIYRSEVEGTDTYVVADIVLYDFEFTYVVDNETTKDVDESVNNGKITLKGIKDANKKGATTLMPLVQNTATALSAYVYLDGDDVENGDVAANAATSMVGSINLQFSSDAELKPMEYSELMNPSTETTTTATTAAATTTTATTTATETTETTTQG